MPSGNVPSITDVWTGGSITMTPSTGTPSSTATGAATSAATATGTPGCAPLFSVASSPNSGTSLNYLHGVSGVASGDVWAVGYTYNVSTTVLQTLAQHWDGAGWNLVPSPNVGADNNVLQGVSARTGSDVWAVGYYNSGTQNSTLIERWNGTRWSVVSSPNSGAGDNYLTGVSALAPNDVWAVGYYNNADGLPQTLIQHWNGTQWSIVTSPSPALSLSRLQGVAALSPSDVWAAGYYNTPDGVGRTLTLHWNGTAWSIVTSPNSGAFSNGLQSVSARAANDVWAVGEYYNYANNVYTGKTLILHWNGTQWTQVASPNVGAGSNLLYGVSALAPDSVWAVGFYANSSNIAQSLVTRWNGSSWNVVSSPNSGAKSNYLFAVAALSANDVRLAGSYTHGIIGGYPCNTAPGEPCVGPQNRPYFRTSANATRGQISKIVALTRQYNDPPGEQLFQDVAPGSPFYQYVQQLARRNILGGYPCNTAPGEPCVAPQNRPYFRSSDNATRGQTAKIVSNAFFPNCQPQQRAKQ